MMFASGRHVHFYREDMLCAALLEINTAEVVAIADIPKTHYRHTIAMSEGYDILWPHLTSVCRCLSGC